MVEATLNRSYRGRKAVNNWQIDMYILKKFHPTYNNMSTAYAKAFFSTYTYAWLQFFFSLSIIIIIIIQHLYSAIVSYAGCSGATIHFLAVYRDF